MKKKIGNFSRGQSMAEYALILSAIAVVVFAGYQALGSAVTSVLATVNTVL